MSIKSAFAGITVLQEANRDSYQSNLALIQIKKVNKSTNIVGHKSDDNEVESF